MTLDAIGIFLLLHSEKEMRYLAVSTLEAIEIYYT